jgi:plasmid stabilization system protein ParE
MIGYRFLTPAEEEMIEAALYYEAASTGLGTNFLDDVQRVVDNLRQYPEAGAAIADQLRRMLLHRFPFGIIYAVVNNELVIVAVAHHGRRPGYWQSRVDR